MDPSSTRPTTNPAGGSLTPRYWNWCTGADVLINDAQFKPEQLAGSRKGWGHSSWEESVRLAKAAGVRQLVLFHHDPDSTDKDVDEILGQSQSRFDEVCAAAEGMVLTMDGEHIDVSLPITRELVRHQTELAARVAGYLPDGRAFDEEALIRDLSIQGAFCIQLNHAPKLHSTLQVTISGLDGNVVRQPLVLRGHVVRLESTPCPNKTGVGILFTE